jgi:hypothetical protein
MFQLAGIRYKKYFPDVHCTYGKVHCTLKSQVKLYYLERFDVDARLVLLLDGLDDALDDELGDVVHVTSALCGGDTVHEGHLLEPRVEIQMFNLYRSQFQKSLKNAVMNRMCPWD